MRRHTFIALLTAFILTACSSAPSGPERIATLIPTDIPPTEPPQPIAEVEATFTPAGSPPPAIILPDVSGVSPACDQNTLRQTITKPDGSSFSALTRINALDDSIYILGDGGLYRSSTEDVISGEPNLEPILLPEERVAGKPVQELTHLAIDARRGQVYLLDKAGHLFRYEIATEDTTLIHRAAGVEDQPLDSELIALTLDSEGRPILLDSAQGALWTPTSIERMDVVNEARGLTRGVDITSSAGRFYILEQDGTIRLVNAKVGSSVWRDAGSTRLGLGVKTSDHLGIELLMLIDGLKREVTGITPSDGRSVMRIVFDYEQMGLLRDVVFTEGRLYAIAENELFTYPGIETGSDCPPPVPGYETQPTLYGLDMLTLNQGAILPLEGEWVLPPWPRVYPGASRLYRYGVHRGLDLYGFSGPSGFKAGWPVLAMRGGTVTRATLAYTEFEDRDEWDALIEEAEKAGYTPPDVLQRLEGKQVILDHGDGVFSIYSHLEDIAPGVVTGARIEAGEVIGTVGVSGTLGEVRRGSVGAHLHFEMWVGENYLGYGLSIREAMWWVEQIIGR